jgi:hypothetical protein
MRTAFLKVRPLCLLLVFVFASLGNVFAQNQTQTAYEKKKAELLMQIWEKYGQRTTALVGGSVNKMNDDEIFQLAQDAVEGQKIAALYGKQTPEFAAIIWYAMELKKAQKLKTEVDFKKEKDAAYAKTDAGNILKSIKYTFNQWSQKGEFEKQSDYEGRLKNLSQNAFSKICTEQIQKRINEKRDGHYNDKLESELLTYNSENESFTIQFKFNNIVWQNIIKISITDAENFKTNWSYLENEINNYDWCFVENSLFPTTITLQESSTKYNFALPLQNQQEISFAFNDLDIENSYLKDFVFKYSTVKEIAKQKQIRDSLEFVSYNNKLAELVDSYNQQLLQNSYNIDKMVITDSYQLNRDYFGNKERLEQNFESNSNSIQSDFERLNRNFDYERSKEYRKNGNLFASESEFDAFYTKGKDAYQAEVERKTTLNFFVKDSEFIKTMDFQKKAKETIGSAFVSGYTGTYTNYNKINADRQKVLSAISESKNKLHYSQIVDFVVETNKELNKEFSKNGQYFANKTEFYEAFISENYKEVLKANKKK